MFGLFEQEISHALLHMLSFRTTRARLHQSKKLFHQTGSRGEDLGVWSFVNIPDKSSIESSVVFFPCF